MEGFDTAWFFTPERESAPQLWSLLDVLLYDAIDCVDLGVEIGCRLFDEFCKEHSIPVPKGYKALLEFRGGFMTLAKWPMYHREQLIDLFPDGPPVVDITCDLLQQLRQFVGQLKDKEDIEFLESLYTFARLVLLFQDFLGPSHSMHSP